MSMNFKKKFSLEQRKQKNRNNLQQNPDKIFIIFQRCLKSNIEFQLKLKCQHSMKIRDLCTFINKKFNQIDLQLFAQDKTHCDQWKTVKQIYDHKKNQDGFLYLRYSNCANFYPGDFPKTAKYIIYGFVAISLVAIALKIKGKVFKQQ